MKAIAWVGLLVFAMTASAATDQKRVLRDPIGETVFWAFHDLAELEPDLTPIVKQRMARERDVNEFNRAEKQRAVEEKLMTEYGAASGYTHIELNLTSNVSEYDATYQEFYFDSLGPGSYVSYTGHGKTFQIRLINAEDGSIWSLSPEKAEAIVGLLGPYRQVSLRLYLEILGVSPTSTGGEIETKIHSFKIYPIRSGKTNARKIGEMNLVED